MGEQRIVCVGIKFTYYIRQHAMSCLETFEGGIAT